MNKNLLQIFRWPAWLALFAVVLPVQSATHRVEIGNYYFNPTNLTINVGDTVLWTNTVVTAHDTTSATGLWNSPTFTRGNTFSFTFNNAGDFSYICAVHIISHPEQTGLVRVASSPLPPTVSITSPADGDDFSIPGSFALSATASSSRGIASVEFFNGITSLGVDSNAPYGVDVSGLPAGNYTLTAVATDSMGLSGTSSPVRIAVGTTRIVKIANYYFTPTNLVINAGDTVIWSNTVTTAHDTTSATGLWASPTFGSGGTYSRTFNDGGSFPYICAVHIISHPEQTGTVSVISVPNLPPSVTIASPANGSEFVAPATFDLTAMASDSDGSVAQVEFFNGGALLGVVTQMPYSVTVQNLAAGSYSLSAVATDDKNLKATNSINVVVKSPPMPVTLVNSIWSGGEFRFSFASETGRAYQVHYTDALDGTASWTTLTNVTGSGSLITITNGPPSPTQRFFRVESK